VLECGPPDRVDAQIVDVLCELVPASVAVAVAVAVDEQIAPQFLRLDCHLASFALTRHPAGVRELRACAPPGSQSLTKPARSAGRLHPANAWSAREITRRPTSGGSVPADSLSMELLDRAVTVTIRSFIRRFVRQDDAGQINTRSDIELVKGVPQVRFHGVGRERELGGDGAVGESACGQSSDSKLGQGQASPAERGPPCR
jgi:hypothetical protein